MSNNKDSGSGGKSNTNRSHGKYNSFCAPTSGLEDVVFKPYSLDARFNKNNDWQADHVGVSFRRMVPTMGKALRKLAQLVLAVPSMPNSKSKTYDAEIIEFAEIYKLANQGICKFKDAKQQSYNLYKQHYAEAMLQKLTTLPEWETFKEDMDGVGLAKILCQVFRKRGEGGKQQMLNILKATKDAYMCWKQRDSFATYYERFLETLEVVEAVNSIIGRNIATDNIVLKEWGLDTSDPGRITEGKRAEAFAEGEKRFRAAMFFSGLSDHKYGELKDNVHNSYLAVVDIRPQMYYSVLYMEDGFQTDYCTSALQWRGAEE